MLLADPWFSGLGWAGIWVSCMPWKGKVWALWLTKHQGEKRGQEKEEECKGWHELWNPWAFNGSLPQEVLRAAKSHSMWQRWLCCAHSDSHPLLGPGRITLGDPSDTHGCCLFSWPGRVSWCYLGSAMRPLPPQRRAAWVCCSLVWGRKEPKSWTKAPAFNHGCSESPLAQWMIHAPPSSQGYVSDL